MALRLSNQAPVAKPAARSIAELAGRAQAALATLDLETYRDLFGTAAELEDPHRRYKARVTLIQHGFEAIRTLPAKDLPPVYLAIARSTVELLEQEPREPVLVNYLGVVLHELGAYDAAEALFRAARTLDPVLPHVARNLSETRARRRSGRRPQLQPPVAAALRPLAGRAKAIAGRARPANGLKLSLCMIVKDEEEMLPRCLEAVAPAVDEIIVVDTGSTDATVAIAESFGARVIHHQWNGSFADARNVSLDAANGDWVLYLDADEVLVAEDAKRLRKLTGHVWREAFFLVETNFTGELEDGTAVTHSALRMWRNRPAYRFTGRLHEQIAHHFPNYLPERLETTTVRVEHYGYLGVVREAKAKSERNIELLEREAAEGVDTPFQAFNLGSEYAALGNAQGALEQFAKAWSALEPDPAKTNYPYMPSLTSRYVKALRVCGHIDAAERRAEDGLALFPGFTDLVFEQAWCARNRGRREQAAELFERCLAMGDAPARYSATVGCGTHLALLSLAEMREQLGSPDEAVRLLVRCLDEHPRFIGAVYPLASTMLRSGASADDVAGTFAGRIDEASTRSRFLVGTALYEAGHSAAARDHFEAVLERQPSSGPARIALVETLLSERRLEDAAEAAQKVPAGDPCAAAARRSELFAELAAGKLAAAARIVARSRSDLPAADIKLFEAWHALASGEAAPAVLPADCAPLLMTMLEALLRIVDIDNFVLIAPLAERVGLTVRERREQLASMYMRRGFLDSAVDEWTAACSESGPDAAALVGLARIASAKQLPEDALVFAREAQAIEPEHPVARLLVERLEPVG